jgi:hypothetical protein
MKSAKHEALQKSGVSLRSLAVHSFLKKPASCLHRARWNRQLHSGRGHDNEPTYRRVAHFRSDDRWVFISMVRRTVGRRPTGLLCVPRVWTQVFGQPPRTFALLPYYQSGTTELRIGVSRVLKTGRHGVVMCPFGMHVPRWHITRNVGWYENASALPSTCRHRLLLPLSYVNFFSRRYSL